jgi:hypothetical protein
MTANASPTTHAASAPTAVKATAPGSTAAQLIAATDVAAIRGQFGRRLLLRSSPSMELTLLGRSRGVHRTAGSLYVCGQRTGGRGATARQRRPSGHNPVISTMVDIPSVRAVELDAVIRALDDRLELAAEDEREVLTRARAALERELATLLVPVAA